MRTLLSLLLSLLLFSSSPLLAASPDPLEERIAEEAMTMTTGIPGDDDC